MHKKLGGGGTAGTADPDRPKGCSSPCDTTLSSKTGRGAAAQGWARHHSVGGEQLVSLASLALLGSHFCLFVIFLLSAILLLLFLSQLFLSQPTGFSTFTLLKLFPSSRWGRE